MKKLKNWDNKTWLSSKSYIFHFNKFLKTKINLNKNSNVLLFGCEGDADEELYQKLLTE